MTGDYRVGCAEGRRLSADQAKATVCAIWILRNETAKLHPPQYPVAGPRGNHFKLCDFLLVTPETLLY